MTDDGVFPTEFDSKKELNHLQKIQKKKDFLRCFHQENPGLQQVKNESDRSNHMMSRRRAKQKTHIVTSILPALCGKKNMHHQSPVSKHMIEGIKEAEEQGHDTSGYCSKCYSFLKKNYQH